MQERSMSIPRCYLVVTFLHSLTQLKAMMRETLKGLKNIMNESNTEFVAVDESVISTNIIRNEEIGDQSSSVSVPEISVYILSTQNEDETNTLDWDEPNCAPAIQRTSNQSPSPANQRTANQSPAAATQRTSNQSPAAATKRTAD